MKIELKKELFGSEKIWEVLPGTAVVLVMMLLAMLASRYLGSLFKAAFELDNSPVSEFLVAMVFGMIVRNLITFPGLFNVGFKFCVAKLLRLGIILLGIRLSIVSVAQIGAVALVAVFACVAAGILVTTGISRLLSVPPRLGTLIAAGTAICGISAIVATAPAIGASDEETAYAVSTITIFGLLATMLYPYLAELVLHLNPAQAGLFLGTAVHDTSQVTGAAYIYDQIWDRGVSEIAITTKLVRNTFMVIVIPLLSYLYSRKFAKLESAEGDGAHKINVRKIFPMFVLGFLGFSILRSVGDLLSARETTGGSFWLTPDSWLAFHTAVRRIAAILLLTAVTATGLSTRFSRLKELTLKPFLIGFIAAAGVGMVSYAFVRIMKAAIGRLLL
ncbi:MAG: putative sulfate exporter family transporter [Spirochaetaceae bacterium]|nr:MAG: putative sulfate exporter family transporter [Spirochaetaceae bacterium]